MFKIYDGREFFYQWDKERKLIVYDDDITEVHFCNKTEECSLKAETYKEGNLTLVNVPNVLLTTDWKINVYAYDKDYTKHCDTFRVISRSKPENYIYTEAELKQWEQLQAQLEALEVKVDNIDTGGAGGYIAPKYELVQEIVFTDENKAVATQFIDVVGYKKLVVMTYSPTHTTTNSWMLRLYNNEDKICGYGQLSAVGTNSEKFGSIVFEQDDIFTVTNLAEALSGNGYPESGLTGVGASKRQVVYNNAPFKHIKIFSASSKEYPVGAKITVYGIRG